MVRSEWVAGERGQAYVGKKVAADLRKGAEALEHRAREGERPASRQIQIQRREFELFGTEVGGSPSIRGTRLDGGFQPDAWPPLSLSRRGVRPEDERAVAGPGRSIFLQPPVVVAVRALVLWWVADQRYRASLEVANPLSRVLDGAVERAVHAAPRAEEAGDAGQPAQMLQKENLAEQEMGK